MTPLCFTPFSYWPASDVKLPNARFSYCSLRSFGAEAGDESVLPDSHQRFAAKEEVDAAERLPHLRFFVNPLPVCRILDREDSQHALPGNTVRSVDLISTDLTGILFGKLAEPVEESLMVGWTCPSLSC